MGNKIDTIVIFDFGGQYCHLIGRRIREFGVYTRILPYDTSSDELVSIDDLNIKGIILSGGPDSVFEKDAPKCDIGIFRLGIPVLGICYGHQLIAHLLGGKVESSKKREYGPSYVSIDKSIDILKGLDEREKVWMSHGDRVLKLPREYQVLAQTDNSPISAFRNEKGNIFGIQWHPEVSHTEKGGLMLRNFVFSICGCKSSWDAGSFVDEVVDEIKDVVGEGECIVALSGGVDSSTAALLVS